MSIMKDMFINDMDNAMDCIKDYSIIEDTINEWQGTDFTAIDIFNDYNTNANIFDIVVESLEDMYNVNDAILFNGFESYAQDLIESLHDDIINYINEIMSKIMWWQL